jgi:ribosomal protein S2
MQKSSLNLNLKLTINQMLLINMHVGHSKKFLNGKVKPYLLGVRNNINILNISKSPFQFKLLINILINLVSLRNKILIVKDRDLFNFRNLLNLKNVYYYDKK